MSARDRRRELGRLLRRKKFLSMRLAGRSLVDLLHFGKGTVERVGAACVLAASFFLVGMVVFISTGAETGTGLTVSLGAFAAAAGTLMVFVLGPSDDQTREDIESLDEPIAEERAAAQVAERGEAEGRWSRDEAEERRPKRGRVLDDDRDDNRDDREPSPRRKSHPNRPVYIDRTVYVERRGVGSGIAALLSFLFVGAGQIARGRVLTGLLWMLTVYLLYAFSPCTLFLTAIVAVILHVLCILDAASH